MFKNCIPDSKKILKSYREHNKLHVWNCNISKIITRTEKILIILSRTGLHEYETVSIFVTISGTRIMFVVISRIGVSF